MTSSARWTRSRPAPASTGFSRACSRTVRPLRTSQSRTPRPRATRCTRTARPSRATPSRGRNEVFAVAAPAERASNRAALLLHGALTNTRGQTVASTYIVVRYPEVTDPAFALPQPFSDLAAALAGLGLGHSPVNT